jgi:hypothetical protein
VGDSRSHIGRYLQAACAGARPGVC